jgi:hypothetical protein
MPETRCPVCHWRLNGASSDGMSKPPKPGDFSVCINCASLLVFSRKLTLRPMQSRDWSRLKPGERDALVRYQQAIRNVHRMRDHV